jgi:nucleotide-binding universal stress UspA family protein
MTYATLMVHMQLGETNAGVLQVTGDLARRFDAKIIGIAACQPMPIGYEGGYWSGQAVEQCRLELEREIREAEAEFRATLKSHGDLAWRSTITMQPLADYMAREARCADLVLAGVVKPESVLDMSRQVHLGDFVMQAGRPVLVVPAKVGTAGFTSAVVGWKDTREARRAVVDALPLLRKAARVCVVEIAAEDELDEVRDRLADVAAWLERHGVVAKTLAAPSTGSHEAMLETIAVEHGADFIVAGAYGHSRLREWALGGMTRRLITHPDRCVILTH